MRHTPKIGPELAPIHRGLLTMLLLAGAGTFGSSLARADAVDDLRQTLQSRLKELRKPNQTILEHRRALLQKQADNLRTMGDLRRALALKEWKGSAPEIEAEIRHQIGSRLIKAYQDVIKNGDVTQRLAVGSSIAEIGPTIRSLSVIKGDKIEEGDPAGFGRSLTPEVIQLTQDKDRGVREQALRALGTIFPKPQDAAPVFKNALEKESPDPKRIAAEGLEQMVRVATFLERPGQSETSAKAFQGDVLDTVAAVLGANSVGLQDPNPRIRAQCLRNIQAAAEATANLIRIGEGFSSENFPPEGRKLNVDEKNYILNLHDVVANEIKEFSPVLTALREQGPALARSLEDPDNGVRFAAVDALENIGNARVRLKKKVLSVPLITPMENGGDRGIRELLASNDILEKFIRNNLAAITNLLNDPDVKIRRKAVDFLDIIEDAATPALPLLTKSLQDPDRFVRWSAARAISNIAPDKAAVAVPGLAKLLSDPDLNVRLAASKTLKEMGPVARAAVPALAIAVNSGDVEARLAAMEALQSIGPEFGKAAVPQLIEALTNFDPRIRRTAAKTLGDFGPAAFAAIPVLRRMLGDQDAEVRVHAGDAILAILQRTEKF